jgi:seryl-tRNA synthetase
MEISEIPGNTYSRGFEKDTSLDEFGKVKIDSLKENIVEIDDQIAERKEISEEFMKKGDKMKLNIKNFLMESTPMGEDDSDFARERAELRKKQIEIDEMLLNERVNCWKDVVLLNKDLREKEKELFERENRIDAINQILGEDLEKESKK